MKNNKPTDQKEGFQKKYTVELAEAVLKKGEKTLREIIDALGCSKSTAENLIHEMETLCKINKRNIRTEKKPMWMYSLKR